MLSHSACVTMATDRDFDSVVFGSGKNAFVKFYAPWCASR